MINKVLMAIVACCATVNAHAYSGSALDDNNSNSQLGDVHVKMAETTELDPQELELFYTHYGNFSNLQDEDGHEILPPGHDLGPGWPIPEPMSADFLAEITGGDAENITMESGFPLIVQPVSFVNFVKTDGTGRNSYAAFQAQIDQLNDAYSSGEAKGKFGKAMDTRIRFKLAGVRYVVNNDYFDYCALPTVIAKSRPRYMMDGARHLNVYVCWCQMNLGLSWLPQDSWYRQNTDESHYALGTIIHWELLPGNKFRGGLWNKGNILTHEIGHYYGLKHPYQGDCSGSEANSDGIADTPRMSGNPLATCKAVSGRDSCKKSPQKDDMANYMVATADSCRNHFTPGQVSFMQNIIRKLKPTLMKQPGPSCVAAIDSSDNSPDLQPCLDGTLRESNGRQWCKTDPDNDSVWGWACCPSSGSNWDQDKCRKGTPDFGRNSNADTPNVVASTKGKGKKGLRKK